MSLWNTAKSAGKAVGKAVKKAAKVVGDAVTKAADVVSDAVETVGNVVGDGLKKVAESNPRLRYLGWIGLLVSGTAKLAAAAIKSVGGMAVSVVKIVAGLVTFDGSLIVEGLKDLGHAILGAVIVIGGAALAFLQESVFPVVTPRHLNALELQLISLVFHNSIAKSNVRVVDGYAGVYSISERPFVLGNTIYMKNKTADANPEEFVHECVHVWQYQHYGSRYASEALTSQWWGVGYEWENEASAGKDWDDFGREAQAELIGDVYYHGGVRSGVTGSGAFFAESDEAKRAFLSPDSGTDWTDLANVATRRIRGASLWRVISAVRSSEVRTTHTP